MNPTAATRAPDYLYSLKSEEAYGWWTGLLRDGRQVLISSISGLAVFFDRAGHLLSYEEGSHWRPGEAAFWGDDLGYVEDLIHVRRFAIPQHGISIEDLDGELQDFLADPSDGSWSDEEREEYPQCIREWLELGQYVFHINQNCYFMSKSGEVESS
jgi:hypothetical protein